MLVPLHICNIVPHDFPIGRRSSTFSAIASMRPATALVGTLLVAVLGLVNAFRPSAAGLKMSATSATQSLDPLLLRVARGEKVERPPVWMMRQAGRHMKCYRELKANKSFRELSESAELSTEVSMQPYRKYKTDGVILFSDILTPLPGMGISFDIAEKEGPKLRPFQSTDDVDRIHPIDPEKATPFVGQTLRNLRKEVGNDATVLGFVGLPFTLATYIVEGGPSVEYLKTKKMAFERPELLHRILTKLADNIAQYAIYQIDSGAQVIQCFDSWASCLSAKDYDEFADVYQRRVIEQIKKRHPHVPIIIYINKSGALIEKMAKSGADILSLDWTVSIADARRRIANDRVGIQGNLDPLLLYAPQSVIKSRTNEIIREAIGQPHIVNLGHGIDANTPEEQAAFFVDTVKAFRY